jgi:8-oxo-(d)GTP phosphatase
VAQIVAAGAVVSRKGREVLLVHRPKHDDWSFPKGKLEPDEHVVAAAVREVGEETGLDIRLGPPLSTQSYPLGDAAKVVHYWAARVTGGDDVATYRPNHEVDQVAWVPLEEAAGRLTYERDRHTLAEFAGVDARTRPLLVVRHADSVARGSWRGADGERPLSEVGEVQAERLVPVLGAYDVQRVLSSSSRRCWTTVAPYAEVADVDVEVVDALSEEEATREAAAEQVRALLARSEPAALCTHRPVLPWVLEELGVGERRLEKADLLVVHHRHGRVVAVEHHAADPATTR